MDLKYRKHLNLGAAYTIKKILAAPLLWRLLKPLPPWPKKVGRMGGDGCLDTFCLVFGGIWWNIKLFTSLSGFCWAFF